MPFADPEAKRVYHKAYHAKWYEKHKKKRRAAIHARRLANRAWVNAQKKECVDCGEADTRVLEFHHLDPSQKEVHLSHATRIHGWGKARLATEIAKCVVLCRNCHMKRHSPLV